MDAFTNVRLLVAVAAFATAFVSASPSAHALQPDANGWYRTGVGVRKKKVAFLSVDVYRVTHDMRALPSQKTKQAIIEMDTDKVFTWQMLRSVDAEKIQNAFREGYALNGYRDGAKIAQFTGAVTSELKEGYVVRITYSAASKSTTIQVQGGGTATVPGVDFMHATWSLWFGKIDQSSLGDDLMKNL